MRCGGDNSGGSNGIRGSGSGSTGGSDSAGVGDGVVVVMV